MAQMGYQSREAVPASVVRGVGGAGWAARGEAVAVRRCVDIGGATASAPVTRPAVRVPAAPLPVVVAPPIPVEPQAARTTSSEPAGGRLIPMPCLVAGGSATGPASTRPATVDPALVSPALMSAAAVSPVPESSTRPIASALSAPDAVPHSSTQPVAYAPPPPSSIEPTLPAAEAIPFVSAQLVVMAPARRARPEPQLPVVMVRPSLVLTSEQLAHDEPSALLMLAPPDVADFCVTQRSVNPSAPTLPPLSTRTVPLPQLRTRTVPLPQLASSPELEPAPEPLELARGMAPWALVIVLVAAFAVGLLVTTALVVTFSPTSCR